MPQRKQPAPPLHSLKQVTAFYLTQKQM